jgi:hypothetical protein
MLNLILMFYFYILALLPSDFTITMLIDAPDSKFGLIYIDKYAIKIKIIDVLKKCKIHRFRSPWFYILYYFYSYVSNCLQKVPLTEKNTNK